MTEVRYLYFYGEPEADQRWALAEGKKLLDVDWLIQPVQVDIYNPPAGVVMAFEEPEFCFLEGYVQLTYPYTPERMAAALREIFGITDGRYITTPEQWLSSQLGVPVKFLYEEQDVRGI